MLEFVAMIIIISASGVLSPGPLLASNLLYASKYGYRSGLLIAHGHAIVELPLIIALALSSISIGVFDQYNTIIGVIGGVALITFGLLGIIKKGDGKGKVLDKPLLAGVMFSALNPFFIAWWLTIGMKLINDSIILLGSILGVFIMFAFHIWMDYAWLTFTAYLTRKGVSMLDNKYYKYLLLAINFTIIYFGINFIVESILDA